MNFSSFIAFFIFLFACQPAEAQDLSIYQKKWFTLSGDSMPYRLALPEIYDPAKKYPLILFLHGSGERGNDNEAQLAHAGKIFAASSFRHQYQAIVLFPQCSENGYWSNVERHEDAKALLERYIFKNGGDPTRDMFLLMALVKHIRQYLPVDPKRTYVGGLSMGGMGTFELVSRMPGVFAKAFPICGGAEPGLANRLGGTSWFVYHGLKDDVVSHTFSKNMVKAMRKKNIKVKLTLFPDANHNAWDPALADSLLMPWLFGK